MNMRACLALAMPAHAACRASSTGSLLGMRLSDSVGDFRGRLHLAASVGPGHFERLELVAEVDVREERPQPPDEPRLRRRRGRDPGQRPRRGAGGSRVRQCDVLAGPGSADPRAMGRDHHAGAGAARPAGDHAGVRVHPCRPATGIGDVARVPGLDLTTARGSTGCARASRGLPGRGSPTGPAGAPTRPRARCRRRRWPGPCFLSGGPPG